MAVGAVVGTLLGPTEATAEGPTTAGDLAGVAILAALVFGTGARILCGRAIWLRVDGTHLHWRAPFGGGRRPLAGWPA